MKLGRAVPALQRDNSLSAVSCPICRHMLRVNTLGFEPRSRLTTCPHLVEGALKFLAAMRRSINS